MESWGEICETQTGSAAPCSAKSQQRAVLPHAHTCQRMHLIGKSRRITTLKEKSYPNKAVVTRSSHLKLQVPPVTVERTRRENGPSNTLKTYEEISSGKADAVARERTYPELQEHQNKRECVQTKKKKTLNLLFKLPPVALGTRVHTPGRVQKKSPHEGVHVPLTESE